MSDNRQQYIEELLALLREQGEKVRSNKDNKTTLQMLERADVLLDLIKFLKDYEENVKVLNAYWLDKHYKEKYNQYIDR